MTDRQAKNYYFTVFVLLLFLFMNVGHAATLQKVDENYRCRIFYTEADRVGWEAIIKGKVQAIGAKLEAPKGDLKASIEDKTKITVRLYDRFGIKEGDELFVVNSRNLIVSRMKVKSIFKSLAFGYMLRGEGNFILANVDDRVVQKLDSEYSGYAYIYKARGDYYNELGQFGKAINNYKRALDLDKGHPESHLYLGYIYLKDNLLQFAFNEFHEAKKNISRLYDNEDKFLLLKGMALVRYREAYFEKISNDLRIKYIKEGIEYSKDALKIYPESRDVNFYLGMFYYKNPWPDDIKAKNQFLKVIDIDPDNVKAYVALSELYYKHRNKKKSRMYAKRALDVDPTDKRAKFLLNLTE